MEKNIVLYIMLLKNEIFYVKKIGKSKHFYVTHEHFFQKWALF